MLARSLLLNVAGSLQFISQSRLKPITQYRVTVLAVPKSAEQVLEYRWRALSFCEPPNQFILVSKRNTPGVWLRSTRLFDVRTRLAGYEDVNDTERLCRDPAMRWVVGDAMLSLRSGSRWFFNDRLIVASRCSPEAFC